MAGLGEWRGLFDWSMSYADGTKPTDFSSVDCNPEKMKWLETIMKEYMVDFAKRMTEIKGKLDTSASQAATAEQLSESERLLDELMDIVESIDFARDLQTIGGLSTLLDMMKSSHPGLRWRAAEVSAICCQNNPPVQEWFLQGGALPVVTELLRAGPEMVRLKGLLAVSSLTRGFPPALAAFLQEPQGLALIVEACRDESDRLRRKGLEALKSICSAAPAVRSVLASTDAVPDVVLECLNGTDTALACSAIGLLTELVDDRNVLQALTRRADLKASIAGLQQKFAALEGEDRDAVLEEIDQLRNIADAWKPPRV